MEDDEFSDTYEEGDEEKAEELDPENPQHYFPIMEKNFNKVIAEIESNPEAAVFADEYNKLFEAFFNAYNKQKELDEETKQLHEQIVEKDKKISLAVNLADEDKKTIDSLKSQITHAWKLADAAHSREQVAQEIIDNLRRQVENLNAEIDFRNKLNQDTEEMGELSKHKDGLERERDRLINEVTQLNTKLHNALSYQEELERKTSEADLKINEINGQLEDQVAETQRQKKAKEKLEQDVEELKAKIEEKESKIVELHGVIAQNAKAIARSEQDAKETKYAYDKLSKEFEATALKFSRLQDDHNQTMFDLDKSKKVIQDKMLDAKIIGEEAIRLKLDVSKLSKTRELLEKKILAMNTEKDELNSDRTKLRQRIYMLEKEMDDFKKYIDEDKRHIEGMMKEKDVLTKSVQRMQVLQQDQNKLIFIQEQSKKKLEVELDLYFIENNKQKKAIGQLERERDKLAEDHIELTQTIEDNMEDIRQKKVMIFDLKKTTSELENKVRQQQNLYEAMRSDRNSLQKLLQESTAETGELKKKLKILFHHIEQLKEDIGQKEKQLIKDENVMRKLNKEKDNLKIEVMSRIDQIRTLKEELKEKRDEERRLHKCLIENDRTIRQQAKDLEQIMNERDVIGSQLVRRNDEIALLNEKIRILQATLARGETHYEQRIEDIRLLKLEVKRLRQEKNLMSKSLSNMVDLKQEIFHLERDLTKSRLKCTALEKEVQNPLNIHRWRKLEGSDPELLDLLQKIQHLQKRLLQQGSEAVERERQLKTAERLYINLRQVLAKQPGPGIKNELSKTQRALKARGNKLKE
ncbi:unnamed protein product [Acanthoscelides obtectus]|uniref:Cilia- and flagella-associated protein 58 central coiled coil domain-containing protein n=1 Tax=Acanthoscelides obtectus TaxID=200917 RepID=A0A9P0LWJ7_ACAOB|nr:unnamed protein product [Acanthoscelides obtectus]CAK1622570.1 Cilia- and flagella-associated protein 58 [Acanthoscelides obtectus]